MVAWIDPGIILGAANCVQATMQNSLSRRRDRLPRIVPADSPANGCTRAVTRAIVRAVPFAGGMLFPGTCRLYMRMIMLVQMPNEPFNTAIRKGTAGAKVKEIVDALKPESAHFCEHHGERTGIFIVDVKNSYDIPSLSEPWFLSFNARVEFRVAMTLEDLGHAGLDALGKKWG